MYHNLYNEPKQNNFFYLIIYNKIHIGFKFALLLLLNYIIIIIKYIVIGFLLIFLDILQTGDNPLPTVMTVKQTFSFIATRHYFDKYNLHRLL